MPCSRRLRGGLAGAATGVVSPWSIPWGGAHPYPNTRHRTRVGDHVCDSMRRCAAPLALRCALRSATAALANAHTAARAVLLFDLNMPCFTLNCRMCLGEWGIGITEWPHRITEPM